MLSKAEWYAMAAASAAFAARHRMADKVTRCMARTRAPAFGRNDVAAWSLSVGQLTPPACPWNTAARQLHALVRRRHDDLRSPQVNDRRDRHAQGHRLAVHTGRSVPPLGN